MVVGVGVGVNNLVVVSSVLLCRGTSDGCSRGQTLTPTFHHDLGIFNPITFGRNRTCILHPETQSGGTHYIVHASLRLSATVSLRRYAPSGSSPEFVKSRDGGSDDGMSLRRTYDV